MIRKILSVIIVIVMIMAYFSASAAMAQEDAEEMLAVEEVATGSWADNDAQEEDTDDRTSNVTEAEEAATGSWADNDAQEEDNGDWTSNVTETEDAATGSWADNDAQEEDNGDWTSNVTETEDAATGSWADNDAQEEGTDDRTSNVTETEEAATGSWADNDAQEEGTDDRTSNVTETEEAVTGSWADNVVEGEEGIPDNGDGNSVGYAEEYGLNLTDEAFQVGDVPTEYLKSNEQSGTVEYISYEMPYGNNTETKGVYVYLPYGYEESDEQYNVIYLLHASNGAPDDYLDTYSVKRFQCLLDNMIADGLIDPVIVAAPTYFHNNYNADFIPLAVQVSDVSDFPEELVDYVIPAVEGTYRTYAQSTDEEGITASRDHRAVAGFSLGGTVTWDVFIQKMSCARWFLPISEASWDDGNGGIDGIWDSNLSAEVLYEAVIEQGYTSDDFILFVATGTEDVAFDIATSQMVSLLEYGDMFITGKNTSCSMMIGGTHSQSAIYTYMYHIMPSLFNLE